MVPNTGYDFADFLLGRPQSSTVRFGDTSTYFRSTVYNAFAVDDWRVKTNLTINMGLRYEFFTPYSEKYDHIANLDIAPGFTAVAGVTPGQVGPYSGTFPAGLVNPDKNNFSPRIGMAWHPFPKHSTMIRAGYGLFFNGSVYNLFPSRLAAQPPFAATASLVTSTSDPLFIQNGFATAPTTAITNTYAVDRNYRVGYVQTWSFSIQQTLPHNLTLESSYLGTKGTRLDIQISPNTALPGSPLTTAAAAFDRQRGLVHVRYFGWQLDLPLAGDAVQPPLRERDLAEHDVHVLEVHRQRVEYRRTAATRWRNTTST